MPRPPQRRLRDPELPGNPGSRWVPTAARDLRPIAPPGRVNPQLVCLWLLERMRWADALPTCRGLPGGPPVARQDPG